MRASVTREWSVHQLFVRYSRIVTLMVTMAIAGDAPEFIAGDF